MSRLLAERRYLKDDDYPLIEDAFTVAVLASKNRKEYKGSTINKPFKELRQKIKDLNNQYQQSNNQTEKDNLQNREKILDNVLEWYTQKLINNPDAIYSTPAIINHYLQSPPFHAIVTVSDEVPQMKQGGLVRKTQIVKIHKGEVVIPARRVEAVNKAVKKAGLKSIKSPSKK
jgi:hypothetical protein